MSSIKYRADIDGLRAIAVLPVLLFHAGISIFSGGFVGVDVFFVISGYLITLIIVKEIDEERFSFKNFWNRRIRRIIPILFVVIVLSIIAFSFVQIPSALSHFSKSVMSQMAFSSNIFFWRGANYFATASDTYPLLHCWSLAVEEQFYFIFPLFLFGIRKLKGQTQLILLTVLVAASLGLSSFLTSIKPVASFYLLPTRAWEMGFGSILAMMEYFYPDKKIKSKALSEVLGFLGLGMILFGVFVFDKTTIFPSYRAVLPVLGATLIILSNQNRANTVVSRFLSMKFMVYIGLISYSLYLWHWPILVFNRAINLSLPSVSSEIIALVISFVLSMLSYKYIETPTRMNKKLFTTRRLFIFFITMSVIIFIASFSIYKTNGLKMRVPANFVDFKEQAVTFDYGKYCGDKFTCKFDATKETKVFVWGDSHAGAMLEVFRQLDSQRNIGVEYIVKDGCLPQIDLELENNTEKYSRDCREHNKKILNHLSKNKYEYIFIISRYNSYLNERDTYEARVKPRRLLRFMGSDEPFTMEGSQKALLKATDKVLKMIQKNNEKVVFIKQVPSMPENVSSFANKLQMLSDKPLIVNRDFKTYRERSTPFDLISKELNLEILSFEDEFCDNTKCIGIEDRKALYWDDNHISVIGNKRLERKLFEFVK